MSVHTDLTPRQMREHIAQLEADNKRLFDAYNDVSRTLDGYTRIEGRRLPSIVVQVVESVRAGRQQQISQEMTRIAKAEPPIIRVTQDNAPEVAHVLERLANLVLD